MFRKFLVFFLILFTITACYSQQTVKVRKNLPDNNFKIRPLKDTIFYVGVINHFKIIPHQKDCSKIKVITDNGILELTDTCTYQFTPTALKATHIFITKGDKTTTIDVNIKLTPDPIWNLLDSANTISIQKLQAAKAPIFGLKNFNYDCRFKLIWYNIQIIRDGATIADKQIKGNLFPANLFSAVIPGDKLIIQNIGLECPEGYRQLPDITATVK